MTSALAATAAMPVCSAAAADIDEPAELARFTRWHGDTPGQRIGESSLRISGMHCAACAGTIEQALARVPGVIAARVSAAAACATVRWDPALTRVSLLVLAVKSAGYVAVPDTAAAAREQRRAEARAALWRLFVAGFCGMQIMMLATPAYVSAPGELAADHKRLLDWGSWLLSLPVLWFSAAPFFAGAWRSLRQRRIGMDVPVALGVAVAFVASSGAAFDPGGAFGSEVWFDSLVMFVTFLLGGRYLEMRARHHAEARLEDTSQGLADRVMRLAPDGTVEMISARCLQPGDRVRVAVGQAFAADGVVLEGATATDESLLTGESRPVGKTPGDAVVAGSLNLSAPVVMRVERVGADTRGEAIAALMREARTRRPAMLASADRWAAPFLWSVLLLAAGAGAVWSVVEPSRALWVVVSVLIVTCPCALSLAAPSALLAATGAMARRGLLLRRLDAIQGLARMQTLFVDKTGTLTEGRLHVVGVHRLTDEGGQSTAALHAVAASLAAWSAHPLAAALAESASAASLSWQNVHETAGQGLEALDAHSRRWRLGSAAWVGADAHANVSGSSTWLACDNRPLLRFEFDERLRDGAAAAVKALQDDGIRVCLLSGDEPSRVQRLATQLHAASAQGGLSLAGRAGPKGPPFARHKRSPGPFVSGLSPEDKLAAVRAAQARGECVAMLGDGINDAPVLACADVSIAMGEGAAIARTQADGVLVSGRLADLAHARRLARRTLRVVHQNLAWAAVYNAACIPLALLGWLPPWAAGLGMASSSLFVVLNSMRLAR